MLEVVGSLKSPSVSHCLLLSKLPSFYKKLSCSAHIHTIHAWSCCKFDCNFAWVEKQGQNGWVCVNNTAPYMWYCPVHVWGKCWVNLVWSFLSGPENLFNYIFCYLGMIIYREFRKVGKIIQNQRIFDDFLHFSDNLLLLYSHPWILDGRWNLYFSN